MVCTFGELGEWNHSLAGDFLWTNSNFCEAICDVMTPATWSMWGIYLEAVRGALSPHGTFCASPDRTCRGKRSPA
jgi:hypothetical protein